MEECANIPEGEYILFQIARFHQILTDRSCSKTGATLLVTVGQRMKEMFEYDESRERCSFPIGQNPINIPFPGSLLAKTQRQ